MTDSQKIALANIVLAFIKDQNTEATEIPIAIGHLTKAQGIKGFKTAEIGNLVFEFKGKYIIYLESLDGKTSVSIPYNKETLSPAISFLN